MSPRVLVLHPAGLDSRCGQFLSFPHVDVPDLVPDGSDTSTRVEVREIARRIATTLDEPCHVVGLSMGGMVAQWLALDHPQAVRSLLLACTTSRPDPRVMRDRAELTRTAPWEQVVRDSEHRWFSEGGLASERPPVAYARERLRQVPRAVLAAQWSAIAGHDADDRLGDIVQPTTCLAGLSDVSTPVEELAHLSEGVPDARLVTIPGPHYTFLEDPEAFSAAVLEHLTWAEGRAR